LRKREHSPAGISAYLDAIAAGLPLDLAVGRIGDVINGEHYGTATDYFLDVRNTHADALTPSPTSPTTPAAPTRC
jgi:prolipoprotein diacylglyceryltransferase